MSLTNKQRLSIQKTAQRFISLAFSDGQKRDAQMRYEAFGHKILVSDTGSGWITVVYDNKSGTEESIET